MTLTLRAYEPGDARATATLFHETVRDAVGPGYSRAQRQAWSPGIPDLGPWHERLAGATTLLAEDSQGLAGFMTLRNDGYLDLAFVRADKVGSGVAKALYDSLIGSARDTGQRTLTTDASHLARHFFERQGWRVTHEQTQIRQGVALTNYRMVLDLN